MKPIWIFVAGTYRSGSTTQYRIARDLVEASGRGVGIGCHTEAKLKEWDETDNEFIVCKVFEPLWLGFQGSPSYDQNIFSESRGRAIVTIRNPLDIITSMKHREEGRDATGNHIEAWDFEQTAKEFLPVWLGNLNKWIEQGMGLCLTSRFEVMTTDILGECKRIAKFLELQISEDRLREIAQQNTKEGITQYKKKCAKEGIKEDDYLPQIPEIVFGTSGHWRNELTEEQANMVIEYNKEFMQKYGYLK